MKRYDPLHILCQNGWQWHTYIDDPVLPASIADDEYFQYTLDVLGWYTTTVRAVVAEYDKHMVIDGHLGVLWIDVVKYENDPPYSENDLEDMIWALELAEDNLIKIGMPFTPDYKFRGRNKANKKRRNDTLRKMYGMEELERKYREGEK